MNKDFLIFAVLILSFCVVFLLVDRGNKANEGPTLKEYIKQVSTKTGATQV